MLCLRVHGLDLPHLVHRLQFFGVQAEFVILSEQALNREMPEIARKVLGQLAQTPSTQRTILEIRLKRLDGENAEAIELAKSAATACGDSEDADKILLEGGLAALAENAKASREILLPLSKK